MGYETRFSGEMTITPAVSVKTLNEFKEYTEYESVRFEITGNGDKLRHDYSERDGGYIEGIEMATEWLLKNGHKLNGTIEWFGEENTDIGRLVAVDGVITIKKPTITWA